uniref:Serpentine receptor class gamma n=1 Tax=Panagrellus redivivus TaxID=6233 RepID=A0A7E4VCP1_PANRE
MCTVAITMDVALYFQARILGAHMFLPFVKQLPTKGIVPMTLISLQFGTMHAGQMMNFLLAFNRYTVVLLREKYTNFWKRYLKWFLGGIFGLSILMVVQYTITEPSLELYDPDLPNHGYYLRAKVEMLLFNKFIHNALLFATTGLASLYMNVYVLRYLMRHRQKSVHFRAPNSTNEITPSDFRFLASNASTFFLECMVAVIQISMFFIKYGPNNATNPFLLTFQFFVADCAASVPAWFLFFAHNGLRREILSYFWCFKTYTIRTPRTQIRFTSESPKLY